MLVACWSPKGGSGTTVVSAALALVLGTRGGIPSGALLADLAGDASAVLGLADPDGPGLAEWLHAGDEVPDGALTQLEVDAGRGLRLLPLGAGAPGDECRRGDMLAGLLAADARPVVADCGPAASGAQLAVAAAATVSVLVVRPCYLALRRALAAPISPTGVVLVAEPQRSLTGADVEDVLGRPVVAVVPHDPSVARAVDAGLLGRRVPRRLERSLQPLATDLLGRTAPAERASTLRLGLTRSSRGRSANGAGARWAR